MWSRSLRIVSQRSVAVPSQARALSSSVPRLVKDPNRPNSERHAVHKAGDSIEGGLDVQSASVQEGIKARKEGKSNSGEPFDTAAESHGGQSAFSAEKARANADANSANEAATTGSFKDHKGGQANVDGDPGSVGGKEEASPPSFLANVKQAVGLGASKSDHQENKTARQSVKQFSTSARVRAPDATDAAPEDGKGSRTAVDEGIAGEQNPHLKHKQPGQPDSGKGNASSEPHLPFSSSAARAANAEHTDAESQRKARYHTSARQLAANPKGGYASGTVPAGGPEGGKSGGYDIPGEANPTANLHDRPPPPPADLTPSSELPRASAAGIPAHPVTTQAAKDGTLADRNPPPDASAGKIGLDEAWKERTAEFKKQ